LYLSHDLPDMQEIESVYTFIWQWVNQPVQNAEQQKQILDKKLVRAVVINDIYGIMAKSQLELCCVESDSKTINKSWQKLLDSKWIGDEGKILVDASNLTETGLRAILPEEIKANDFDRIFFYLREQKLRFKMIKIPKHLENFVLLHLDRWIESAIRAMCMENERQYIIDADVGMSTQNPEIVPIILDLDTGADQPNSEWDEAMHQFLQLKHGCKLSLQSLKSVFISNVTYFKLYDNLCGMSGTLGSQQEQMRLTKIHDVDFMMIPTHKPKKFIEMETLISKSHESYIKRACETTSAISNLRPVLIICETIKDVNRFFNELVGDKSKKVVALRREADALANVDLLTPGQIVIATNLAGRGMDLKLSDEARAAGGLHVVVAYLPTNVRIEQQAFGRAARAGDAGSGQLCISSKRQNATIFELKQQRNNDEIKRLEKIYHYYTNFIKIEESFFEKFSEQYKNIVEQNKEVNIFKQSFLHNWSFWLDEHSQKIESGCKGRIDSLMKSLKEFLSRNNCNSINWKSSEIHKTSKVHLAIQQLTSKDSNFQTNVELDSSDGVIECYYNYFIASKDEKQSGFVSKDALKRFLSDRQVRDLKSLLSQFEERRDRRLMGCEMMRPLVERNKRALIQVKSLSDQQSVYDQLENVFVDSIQRVLGLPAYPEMFEDIFLLKPILCQEVVDHLIDIRVLTLPKMETNVPIATIELIASKNFVQLTSLVNFIKKHEGDEIDMKTFSETIKSEVYAANREDFWEALKSKNILSNETTFMCFNIVTLQDVDPSFLEHLRSDKMKNLQAEF
jgi:golgin subfamily B member 1